MMDIKKQVNVAILIALAIVISIMESFVPFFIPGFKLGLTNIVILFIIYVYSFKDAVFVSLVRIFIVGILRTGLFSFSFFFSLGGSLFSLLIMYIIKNTTKLSIVGVSLLGALSHTIGQILMSIILFKSNKFLYLLPVLIILSSFTGVIVGIVSKKVIDYYKNEN